MWSIDDWMICPMQTQLGIVFSVIPCSGVSESVGLLFTRSVTQPLCRFTWLCRRSCWHWGSRRAPVAPLLELRSWPWCHCPAPPASSRFPSCYRVNLQLQTTTESSPSQTFISIRHTHRLCGSKGLPAVVVCAQRSSGGALVSLMTGAINTQWMFRYLRELWSEVV